MKRILIFLLIVFSIGSYLKWRSKTTLNNLSQVVEYSELSRQYLISSSQVARSQSFASSGIALKVSPFLDEAQKLLQSAETNLSDLEEETITTQINEAKLQLNRLSQKVKNQEEVGQKELVLFLKQIEELNLFLSSQEVNNYGPQFEKFGELLDQYESFNFWLFIFFVSSLVLATLLFVSEFKRHRFVKELERTQKLHGLLFSSLHDAIFYVGKDGKILTCNQSAAKMLDKNIKSLIGKNLQSFFPGSRILRRGTAIEENIQKIVEKGNAQNDLNLILPSLKDENHWYKFSCQPVLSQQNENSFSMLISMADITNQVVAKQTIQKQQEQLMESSKLQTIGELAGGIAHEINNPLTIISGTAEVMALQAKRKKSLSEEEIKEKTGKISSTIKRISRTITGLLKMARGESEKFVPTSVSEIIDMTTEFLGNILDRNFVSFEVSKPEPDLMVDCHPTQISQVLINLIKNAVDALEGTENKWIKMEVQTRDKYIQFIVTDSGPGISKDIGDKILMPFFTTKEMGKGTGLGLSVSCTIAEDHSGTLKIDYKHANTCFVLTVPLRQADENTLTEYRKVRPPTSKAG